jgi:chlorobactene glucosyltransferase
MSDLVTLLQIAIVAVLVLVAIIAFSNLKTLRWLDEHQRPSRFPRVSVLVPARNEELNIGPCVRSLLAQEYPNFQVLVLDDDSTDGTGDVLAGILREKPSLRVLKGEEPPPDWIGKYWACHQLAEAADGELLLFTDADTVHHPHALRDAVATLLDKEVDLLTAFPREVVVTWIERLVVPFLTCSVLAFMPLGLANRLQMPALSVTTGQFMMFRRSAYDTIGGYPSVRRAALDDLSLGRRIKSHGLHWWVVDGGNRVQCRMYRNREQVFEGYSKNLYGAFDYNAPFYIAAWVGAGLLFYQPLAVLAWAAFAPTSQLSVGLALTAVALLVVLWGVPLRRFSFPSYLALFYPVSMLLVIAIAVRSLVLALKGQATWKGRVLSKEKLGLQQQA